MFEQCLAFSLQDDCVNAPSVGQTLLCLAANERGRVLREILLPLAEARDLRGSPNSNVVVKVCAAAQFVGGFGESSRRLALFEGVDVRGVLRGLL